MQKQSETDCSAIIGDFTKNILNKRYLIERQIGQGSNSQVFKCVDLECPELNLAMKISDDL